MHAWPERGAAPPPPLAGGHQPANPEYAAAVRDSFDRQRIMQLVGARLRDVQPGYVELALPYRSEFTQQYGVIHGALQGLLVDNACAGAALSVFPAGVGVAATEYKVNFVAAARQCDLTARGWVLRPGRTLTTCWAQVSFQDGAEVKLAAVGQATLMQVPDESR